MASRVFVGAMLLVSQASAQTFLYAVRTNGDLIRIDRATGAGVLVGNGGVQADGASAYMYEDVWTGTYLEYILTAGGTGPHADEIRGIDRSTGTGAVFCTITGRPAGYGIRGMAGGYLLLRPDDPTISSLLATIDTSTGAMTVVGPTGRTDLTSIARSPDGMLYAIGTESGGTLYTVSSAGVATPVGGGGFAGDDQALEFMPDGTLLACGANLRVVDPATGATTLIGPTGFTGIRDLAWIKVCYANCDHFGHMPPMLNVRDYTCFLNRFASGDPWANCDLSTTPPVLNVADFLCFVNSLWSEAGCYP